MASAWIIVFYRLKGECIYSSKSCEDLIYAYINAHIYVLFYIHTYTHAHTNARKNTHNYLDEKQITPHRDTYFRAIYLHPYNI